MELVISAIAQEEYEVFDDGSAPFVNFNFNTEADLPFNINIDTLGVSFSLEHFESFVNDLKECVNNEKSFNGFHYICEETQSEWIESSRVLLSTSIFLRFISKTGEKESVILSLATAKQMIEDFEKALSVYDLI